MEVKNAGCYFFIVFQLISINIFAQSTGFENVFGGKFGSNSSAHFISEIGNNNYIFSGIKKTNDSSKVVISRLDEEGYPVWIKELNYKFLAGTQTIPSLLLGEYYYLLNTIKTNQDEIKAFLIKIDFQGNTIWTKIFDDDNYNVVANDINSSHKNNIIISLAKFNPGSNSKIKLIELSPDNSKEWENEFNIEIEFNDHSGINGIMKYRATDYLILNNNHSAISTLIKTDSTGNKIWEKSNFSFTSAWQSFTIRGNNEIVIPDGNSIIILNSNGESIETFELDKTILDITFNEDNGYSALGGKLGLQFFETPNMIIKLDNNFNILETVRLETNINYFKRTDNKNFLFAGNISKQIRFNDLEEPKRIKRMWVSGVDSTLNYKQLTLISPLEDRQFYAFRENEINWLSKDIESVNIMYSSDGGNNWSEIVSNFPAEEGKYNWRVPIVVEGNFMLRVESTGNPSINDFTDNSLTTVLKRDYDYTNINQVKMWISNSGKGSYNPQTRGGFQWPRSDTTKPTAIYSDGLVWGGQVNSEIKIGGNTYRSGLQSGVILENGIAADPDDPEYKIYKIRKILEGIEDNVLKNRLQYDYENWPMENGAPYRDVNNDGSFTPGVDLPKHLGDETLFYVANDLDSSLTLYGSGSIGLETQTAVYAFEREELEDVVFKRYRAINKSQDTLKDAYFSYFSDDDLGNPQDDFAGCDTNLNLAYTWNGDNNDEVEKDGYGENPPAVAHQLLQGPIVKGNSSDTALYKGNLLPGYKNLPMTAYVFYLITGIPDDIIPTSAEEHYYHMQGTTSDGDLL